MTLKGSIILPLSVGAFVSPLPCPSLSLAMTKRLFFGRLRALRLVRTANGCALNAFVARTAAAAIRTSRQRGSRRDNIMVKCGVRWMESPPRLAGHSPEVEGDVIIIIFSLEKISKSYYTGTR